jgi:hypothetical protein
MMYIWRMRWEGHVARTGERIGAHKVLVGRPDGNRQLVKPILRWEGNIKMDLQDVGWKSMDWIDLVQNRYRWRAIVNAVMNLRGSIKSGVFLN